MVPDRYDLELDLDPERMNTFSGAVMIGLTVRSATPFITLNATWLACCSGRFKSITPL